MVDATELVKIFTAIVFGVLLIIALFVYGGEGIIGKVKEALLGEKDVLPKVSVGLEEQKAEVTIPDEHREQILNLQKAIVLMLSGKDRGVTNENCFADYGGFSALGEEGGTSVTFESRGDKAVMKVFAGSGGKQTIDDLSAEFSGMKPCVVALTGDKVDNFVAHFLEEEELVYPYYSDVNLLTISYSTKGINGNRISAPDLELVNVLDDEGYLFTPDGKSICFFPTYQVGGTGYDGLAKGLTNGGIFADSIPAKIKEGKLSMCG